MENETENIPTVFSRVDGEVKTTFGDESNQFTVPVMKYVRYCGNGDFFVKDEIKVIDRGHDVIIETAKHGVLIETDHDTMYALCQQYLRHHIDPNAADLKPIDLTPQVILPEGLYHVRGIDTYISLGSRSRGNFSIRAMITTGDFAMRQIFVGVVWRADIAAALSTALEEREYSKEELDEIFRDLEFDINVSVVTAGGYQRNAAAIAI